MKFKEDEMKDSVVRDVILNLIRNKHKNDIIYGENYVNPLIIPGLVIDRRDRYLRFCGHPSNYVLYSYSSDRLSVNTVEIIEVSVDNGKKGYVLSVGTVIEGVSFDCDSITPEFNKFFKQLDKDSFSSKTEYDRLLRNIRNTNVVIGPPTVSFWGRLLDKFFPTERKLYHWHG